MYLAKIEEHFSQKRGQGLILSPKDWQLAQEWHQEGIPLSVVLRGINRSFEQADSGKQIRSLAYCEAEIKRFWQEYQKQRVGMPRKEDGGQEAVVFPPSCLLELQNCLQASIQKPHPPEVVAVLRHFQSCFQDVFDRQLEGDWEGALKKITNKLVCNLKQVIAPRHLAAIEAEAGQHLTGYEDRMDKTAYKRTFDSLVCEQLLEKYDLGPFSLYTD